jgi:hypothetical protein
MHTMDDSGDPTKDCQQDVDELCVRINVRYMGNGTAQRLLTKSALQPRSRNTPRGGSMMAKLECAQFNSKTTSRQ